MPHQKLFAFLITECLSVFIETACGSTDELISWFRTIAFVEPDAW